MNESEKYKSIFELGKRKENEPTEDPADEFEDSEEINDEGAFVSIQDLDKKEVVQEMDVDAIPKASKKQVNKEKFKRMKEREDRKPYMFYPEDTNKANWDLFITVVRYVSGTALQGP